MVSAPVGAGQMRHDWGRSKGLCDKAASAAEHAMLDRSTPRRSTVMSALLPTGVTYEYQSDSSSKTPAAQRPPVPTPSEWEAVVS